MVEELTTGAAGAAILIAPPIAAPTQHDSPSPHMLIGTPVAHLFQRKSETPRSVSHSGERSASLPHLEEEEIAEITKAAKVESKGEDKNKDKDKEKDKDQQK